MKINPIFTGAMINLGNKKGEKRSIDSSSITAVIDSGKDGTRVLYVNPWSAYTPGYNKEILYPQKDYKTIVNNVSRAKTAGPDTPAIDILQEKG